MTYDDYMDNIKDSADAAAEDQEYLESLPVELAALRAKLAAAEAHGEQYRQNWKSLQDLTGEQCLDRARYAVRAWKEAAEQLAAATERADRLKARAEAAEAERDALRAKLETAEHEAYQYANMLELEEKRNSSLASQNVALRAALEKWQAHMKLSKKPLETSYGELLSTLAEAEMATADALALTPPAALEALRRRERSIGAEEELRRLAELYDTQRLSAVDLLDRADAIAAERDHFADAGKKVNHPGIPESSGGAR